MPTESDPWAANNSVYSHCNNEACIHDVWNNEASIRDVWANNMEEEFKTIRKVVQKYTYIAMDTEYPGIVAEVRRNFIRSSEFAFHVLMCNVNLLKLIQLALTFMDENGNTPPGVTTWQFNFKFNLAEDKYAVNSINMLIKAGIQFEKHGYEGINPSHFAELIMSSGVVLLDNIKWIAFQSGYDFGYFLKLLTAKKLPKQESEFFDLLRTYFPNIYDVKYLMSSCKDLRGGLQEVSGYLGVERIGPQHQAGSDSLLTGKMFFKMKEMYFENDIDDAKYCGILNGLGSSYTKNGYSTF